MRGCFRHECALSCPCFVFGRWDARRWTSVSEGVCWSLSSVGVHAYRRVVERCARQRRGRPRRGTSVYDRQGAGLRVPAGAGSGRQRRAGTGRVHSKCRGACVNIFARLYGAGRHGWGCGVERGCIGRIGHHGHLARRARGGGRRRDAEELGEAERLPQPGPERP
ncbi:hypothetical protein K505DRAFT_106408 [Melanomma pulvis-pyrius CBS 109.77]|uniref:Uncharacterized protein n=1 Tax=Melanomma pulvis-pyrius CBS 109.77 TaxID=1314802 RepID=A0A6A6WWV3_9PLEO|nr:hypothetical protein K505DRAFT_106408 [Melanomma pulvis-pyrius CBS 109.77]